MGWNKINEKIIPLVKQSTLRENDSRSSTSVFCKKKEIIAACSKLEKESQKQYRYISHKTRMKILDEEKKMKEIIIKQL